MKPIERDFIQGVMADAREQNERQESDTAFREIAVRLAKAIKLCGHMGTVSVCDLATLQHMADDVLQAAGAKP